MNQVNWLLDYIRGELKKISVYDIERCLDAYSKTDGLLIILDGLDEVSSRMYSRAEASINQLSQILARSGDNNVVIITMRTQFHQQARAQFSDAYPVVLGLKHFTPTDIYEFLQRWDFPSETKDKEVVRIFTDLTDRPTLREMCANPLILSMYVARDQSVGHSIAPESRTEFYSQVLEELMIRRRATQVGALEAQTVVREQRLKILGRLAYDHLIDENQPANHLDWASGTAVVTEITQREGNDAEAYLRQLAVDTGLITEERERESFRFIHLTFCEFLGAVEAAQSRADGWRDLPLNHSRLRNSGQIGVQTRLSEVLPFAAALLPRHFKTEAITEVKKTGDDRVLALTFLETKLYDHPAWTEFLRSQRETLLIRADQGYGPDWLRDVHLFIVICLDAERAAIFVPGVAIRNELSDFFEILAKKSDSTILRLISSYAQRDAAAAFRVASLCRIDLLERLIDVVIANCDQPPFLALVMEGAARDSNRLERWSCALAEAGLRSPVVARSLAEANIALWAGAKDLERRYRWFAPPIINRNVYTECLSIACKATRERGQFPLLEALQNISSAASLTLTRWIFVISPFISVMLMISYVYGFYLILRTAGAGDLPSAWLVTWISVFIIWNLVTALFHIKVLTYRRLLYIKSLSISAMVAPFSLGIAMSGWRNALKNAGDSVVSAIEVLPGTRLGRLSLRLCFGSTDRRGISLLGSLRGTLRGSEQP